MASPTPTMAVLVITVAAVCTVPCVSSADTAADQNTSISLVNILANPKFASEVKGIQHILLDEMAKVRIQPTNVTISKILQAVVHIDYVNIIRRIVAMFGASNVFPKPTRLSQQCYDHVSYVIASLAGPQNQSAASNYTIPTWALRLLDAQGKPTAGILQGSFRFTGQYEECLDIVALGNPATALQNQTTRFKTRYCRAMFSLPEDLSKLAIKPFYNSFWSSNKVPTEYLHWGVCVPDSCSREDVHTLVSIASKATIDLPLNDTVCFEDHDLASDTGALVTVTILALFGLVIVLSTIVESFIHYDLLAKGEAGGPVKNGGVVSPVGMVINVQSANTTTQDSDLESGDQMQMDKVGNNNLDENDSKTHEKQRTDIKPSGKPKNDKNNRPKSNDRRLKKVIKPRGGSYSVILLCLLV